MTSTDQLYEKGGRLEKWNTLVEQADPDYGQRLFEILNREKVLPTTLDDFRFLSVSANGGAREISFAKALDEKIEWKSEKPEEKPTIFASDIVNIEYEPPKLANVNFVRLRADANKLPITPNSIDVVFDRMGAVWYKVHTKLETATRINGKLPDWETEEITESLREIIEGYVEKLRVGGGHSLRRSGRRHQR